MSNNYLRQPIAIGMLALGLNAHAQHSTAPRAIPADSGVEAQVEQLLTGLTLEEKIGQMCELTIDVITDTNVRDAFVLNEDALHNVLERYKVGSILNVPKGVAQRPEVWSTLIRSPSKILREHRLLGRKSSSCPMHLTMHSWYHFRQAGWRRREWHHLWQSR